MEYQKVHFGYQKYQYCNILFVTDPNGKTTGDFVCSATCIEMVQQKDTITSSTLKELASAGAIANVRLVAQTDGFAVFVRCALSEKVLQAKRGHIRRFKSLERAVLFVRALGLSRVEVDITNWEPHQRSL